MVQDAESHDFAGIDQFPGQRFIVGARLRIARGVVVDENQGGGATSNRPLDDLAGGDGTAVDRAFGKVNGIDYLVLAVEVDNLEDLVTIATFYSRSVFECDQCLSPALKRLQSGSTRKFPTPAGK